MRHSPKLVLVAILLAGTPAPAQEVDEASRAAARQVGEEGLEAYKQGQYEDALEKLNRAYDAVRAPTLGLWTARAMVQLGMLVEASERYVEVSRLEVTGGDTALQEEAKKVAIEEREALLPRIPQLKLIVEGAPVDQVRVQLDGKDVPPSLLGLRRPVNPGVRKAVGTFGEDVTTVEDAIAEGETRTWVLRFRKPAPPLAQPEPTRPSPTLATGDARPLSEPDAGPSPATAQRTLGWMSLGIGGVGLVVGGVTGAMVLSKQNELESSDECANEACGPAKHDEVDEYNALRPVSTTGFVVGGVGVAAGLALLLTVPKRRVSAARLSPWVGLGAAGVRGKF